MTLRAALHEFVRDALDVSVSDGRLPHRPMMPAAVLRFISSRGGQTHSNPVSLLERRVQFDIYSQDDAQADALATSLTRDLDGYHGPMGDVAIGYAALMTDRDMEPEQLKGGEVRYRRVLDFMVAYQEPRTPVLQES